MNVYNKVLAFADMVNDGLLATHNTRSNWLSEKEKHHLSKYVSSEPVTYLISAVLKTDEGHTSF